MINFIFFTKRGVFLTLSTLLYGLFLILGSCTTTHKDIYLVDYVNPLIGTAPSTTIAALKHGSGTENNAQVVPFVTSPFGMTNWTPQTRSSENKCVAPYYYTDTKIEGFRASHWISGSCTQDYGSVTIMPMLGVLTVNSQNRASEFSHNSEVSRPYVYSVKLLDYNIDAQMSATKRSGILKFIFNKGGQAHILLTPNSDEGEGYIKVLPSSGEIVGYNPAHRIYQGWGESAGFSGYFVARVSVPFDTFGVYEGDNIMEGESTISNMRDIGGYLSFNVKDKDEVVVTVGTSFTSIEKARENLEAEIAGKSYDVVERELKEEWELLLSKVKVEGVPESEAVKFYTAMYHSFLHPRLFSDVDGSYPQFSSGDSIIKSKDNYYVDFSMWDTYRASHPLFTLLAPSVNRDMMSSLIHKGEQGGWLPIFPCWNSYTSAMIGDHVIVTLADAFVKGDIELSDNAYKLMLKNAFNEPEEFKDYEAGMGRRALSSYIKYGYIPMEDSVKESFHTNEQVSRTLEYAFDDFALAQVAKIKGDNDSYNLLIDRAKSYKNVYSARDTSVRGRHKDGSFTKEFNRYGRVSYITEGTPFQYTWYVPQDIAGLIDLMGGEVQFNKTLDNFFRIEQYWHGNEPGHQIPFLYNFSGEPWKSQRVVKEICKEEYGDGPGGLSGNDDSGQMSAWYIFSKLGLYPVAPSVGEYVISGPCFPKVEILLESGNKLTILANGVDDSKPYIKSIKVNGENYTKNYFNHKDLMKGGVIEFEMSSTPNREWGVKREDRPYSLSNKK